MQYQALTKELALLIELYLTSYIKEYNIYTWVPNNRPPTYFFAKKFPAPQLLLGPSLMFHPPLSSLIRNTTVYLGPKTSSGAYELNLLHCNLRGSLI